MSEPLDQSVLLLGKAEDPWTERAVAIVRRAFARVEVHLGTWGAALPKEAREWSGDWIISYLSRWVVPNDLLERAGIAAINFHPGPPEYPGVGCTNFAIYDGAREYGVTCHHMTAPVDSGRIVAVRRFPVGVDEALFELHRRTHEHLIELLELLISDLAAGKALPESEETWARPAYTRQEFEALRRIDPAMEEEEIARRVRATRFPNMPGAYLELAGHRFEVQTT